MTINVNLSDNDVERLTQVARGYGYDDVHEYLTDCVAALVNMPDSDVSAALTDAELRASAAQCDQGMEDAKAGRVLSLEELRRRLHAGFGKMRA